MEQSEDNILYEAESINTYDTVSTVDEVAEVAAELAAELSDLREYPPNKRRKLATKGDVLQSRAILHTDDSALLESILSPNSRSGESLLIIHTVVCCRQRTKDQDHTSHPGLAYYHDVPRLFAKDTKASALRGREPIPDVHDLIYNQKNIDIVVYRNHSCEGYHELMKDNYVCTVPNNVDRATFEKLKPWFYTIPEDLEPSGAPLEKATITSQAVMDTFTKIMSRDEEMSQCFDVNEALSSPYDFFFHFQKSIEQLLTEELVKSNSTIFLPHAYIIVNLLSYIKEVCNVQWRLAINSFERGLVTISDQSKVFRRGDLVVHHKDEVLNAYLVEDIVARRHGKTEMKCWNFNFDGGFRRNYRNITVEWPDETVPLTGLSVWPLRLDKAGLKDILKLRGNQFWECRERRLVSYQMPQNKDFEMQLGAPKFIVDIDTHRALHASKYTDSYSAAHEAIDLSRDQPPDEPFDLLMPTTIPGFGFHDKKWRNLLIDYIKPVTWNANAFHRLVLKANKKELIQALVTVHLETNDATDVIEGKGTGLIMLLHGPPGTGKTLTAETVAELAMKPLYRVTCGDIGTDAEGVEKYLESALYLGTIWDCVVLLDEADVFLEERTQNDLARNALVSVFLRVLEYFHGILILTSNRVGLFDEAFKSRMQLVIRYPPLDETGRFKIWDNFFNALHKAGSEMEFEDLSNNVKSLSQKQLNGRQIRNVIKTARQLARFRGQKFNNQHLECAIEVVEEFETYLRDTRGSDEYYARQQRIRYE